MSREKKYLYRIKDLQTGLYFSREFSEYDYKYRSPAISKERCQYKYSIVGYGNDLSSHLHFDDFGHTYATRIGAEKMISKFNGSSQDKRNTKAGMILNCRFTFVVVKTEVRYKDVMEKKWTYS